MGTKQEPGDYDCYAKAFSDEPMFVLLARDPVAPLLVKQWVMITRQFGDLSTEKAREAMGVATQMEIWRNMNQEKLGLVHDEGTSEENSSRCDP